MNFYDVLLAKKIKENHDPRVESLSVTQNGRYEESNVVYSPVVVNVPQPQPVLKAKSITSNGTYNAADESADGYSSVVVDVPLPSNAYLLKYESGDVITVEDGAELPLVKCEAEIEPDQDLHGYDNPWVGGAGKNKLDISLSTSSQFIRDEEIFKNSEIDTQTQFRAWVQDDTTMLDSQNISSTGQYYFNFSLSSTTNKLNIKHNGSIKDLQINFNNTIPSGNWKLYFDVDSCNPSIINGLVIKNIMLVSSTETDSTFAPYTNICSISGRSEVNVGRVGVNLCPIDNSQFIGSGTQWYSLNGTIASVISDSTKLHMLEGTYTIKLYDQTNVNNLQVIDETGDVLVNTSEGGTFTLNSNKDIYIRIRASISGSVSFKTMIEIGSTATAYEPYQGKTYTIHLGDNIYGGELDVTKGELRVTHVIKQFTSTDNSSWTKYGDDSVYYSVWSNDSFVPSNIGKAKETISNEYKGVEKGINSFINGEYVFNVTGISSGYASICLKDERFTTASDFKASLTTPLQLVYPLATPFTIQLTPTYIEMLENTNTIYANTGELEILYLGK